MPPEDLDDQDLEQAMDELNIPKQSVDSGDRQVAGDGGGSDDAAARTDDPLDQIKKLADLHAQGILTDEEFETKKTELLGEL